MKTQRWKNTMKKLSCYCSKADDTRAHADSPKRTIRALTEGYLMGKHETKTTYMH